jgi:hypothetical protein
MRRLLVLVLAALAIAGCEPPLAAGVRAAAAEMAPPPAVLADVALRADAARRAAFAAADPRPLDGVFGQRSLLVTRAQVAHLAARGLRREEVADARRAVHTGGTLGRPEVVLEIRARQRLAGPRPDPPWSTVLRQWQVALERQGGSWLVVDDQDLPPPAWWR